MLWKQGTRSRAACPTLRLLRRSRRDLPSIPRSRCLPDLPNSNPSPNSDPNDLTLRTLTGPSCTARRGSRPSSRYPPRSPALPSVACRRRHRLLPPRGPQRRPNHLPLPWAFSAALTTGRGCMRITGIPSPPQRPLQRHLWVWCWMQRAIPGSPAPTLANTALRSAGFTTRGLALSPLQTLTLTLTSTPTRRAQAS